MRSFAILAVVVAVRGLAAADDGTTPVSVAVGDTVKRDVGYARGLRCDDPSIVAAEIATDAARDVNVVSLTGLKVGRTQCRAGTELGRPVVVFTVDVTAKKQRAEKSLPRR
jgi:hypothetical protein